MEPSPNNQTNHTKAAIKRSKTDDSEGEVKRSDYQSITHTFFDNEFNIIKFNQYLISVINPITFIGYAS